MNDTALINSYTNLLRYSSEQFWVSLRLELLKKGINSKQAVLVESCEQGDKVEFGVVVTVQKNVFQFVWEGGHISEWNDMTDKYLMSPYSVSIECGMKINRDVNTV